MQNKRIIPLLYQSVDSKKAIANLEEQELDLYLEALKSKTELKSLAENNWIQLAQLNWIQFEFPKKFEDQFDLLIETIETDFEYIKEHTRYQVRALEWERQEYADEFLLRGKELLAAREFLIKAETVGASAPTELQKRLISASEEFARLQDDKQKRLRRRILSAALAVIILPYIWLSLRYYISLSSNGSSIVVRAGDPGLKILPGFDWDVIYTDYDTSYIKDYLVIRNERLSGFWFWPITGYSSWVDTLFGQMEPASAALSYWRIGEKDKGLNHLLLVSDDPDRDAIETITYLAFQYPDVVPDVIDVLVEIMASETDDEDTYQAAVTGLEIISTVQPDALVNHIGVMTARLETASSAERIALFEA